MFDPMDLFKDGEVSISTLIESDLDFRASHIRLEKDSDSHLYRWSWEVDPQNFPLSSADLGITDVPLVYKVTLIVSHHRIPSREISVEFRPPPKGSDLISSLFSAKAGTAPSR